MVPHESLQACDSYYIQLCIRHHSLGSFLVFCRCLTRGDGWEVGVCAPAGAAEGPWAASCSHGGAPTPPPSKLDRDGTPRTIQESDGECKAGCHMIRDFVASGNTRTHPARRYLVGSDSIACDHDDHYILEMCLQLSQHSVIS